MQKQQQILKQKLKLSPQQIQFLGLLAIPIVDLEKRIDNLIKENEHLHSEIRQLKMDLQQAQNDADNQRAMANIPRY